MGEHNPLLRALRRGRLPMAIGCLLLCTRAWADIDVDISPGIDVNDDGPDDHDDHSRPRHHGHPATHIDRPPGSASHDNDGSDQHDDGRDGDAVDTQPLKPSFGPCGRHSALKRCWSATKHHRHRAVTARDSSAAMSRTRRRG